MLSAVTAERGKRLQTKAQQGRPTAAIDKLLPAGTVDLEKIPERRDSRRGRRRATSLGGGCRRRDGGLLVVLAAGINGEGARVLHGGLAALAHGSRLRHLCGAGARHHDV